MKKSFVILVTLIFIQCTDKVQNIKDSQSNEVSTQKISCTTELWLAAKANDLNKLQKLLDGGCDVNTIIDSSLDPNGDSLQNNILYYTTEYETMKLLLKAGANPNFPQLTGSSVLETAIALNKNKLAKLLIEHKADVLHYNEGTSWHSPLGAAVRAENIEGLQLLKSHGAKFQNDEHDKILHLAINHQRFNSVKYLLENGTPVNVKSTPYGEGENGDCVQCPHDITPMHSAVLLNDSVTSIKFIDLLLQHHADINSTNKKGLSPLALVAPQGKPEIARHLIQKGATIDSESILRSAAYQNNEYLEVLLKNGGNANASSDYYESALFAAVTCCGDGFNESPIESRIETLKLLLEYGAKPGEKLLQMIQHEERFSMVRDLLTQWQF